MTAAAVTPRKIALAALEIALGYASAGVHEEGGNNRGDQVEFYQHLMGGRPGDPWCGDYVCCCEVKGYARAFGLAEDRGRLLGYVGHAGSALGLALSGYCPDLATSARNHYLFRSNGFTPVPGDLILYDFLHLGEPHHVGIVEYVTREGYMTVEGNTSSGEGGSQADGGGVYRRHRGHDHVFGFVHFG